MPIDSSIFNYSPHLREFYTDDIMTRISRVIQREHTLEKEPHREPGCGVSYAVFLLFDQPGSLEYNSGGTSCGAAWNYRPRPQVMYDS